MSTPLYISDLDGTLLRPDGTLSDYSRDGLNRLIADGMHFTVATARSVVSIRQLLQGLQLSLPVVNLNGALLSDLHSGRHQSIQAISPETAELVFDQIRSNGLLPFISTCASDRDHLYYHRIENAGMQWYLDDRLDTDDNRLEQIEDLRLALADPVLCFTVIDHRRTLLQDVRASLEDCFPGQLQIYLFDNSYSDVGDTWLTIGDAQATKDRGIRQLLAQGGYAIDGLTVFGDSDNDVEMFRLAPRAIATANASEEIRTLATEIIGRNSEDSVVRYLHGQY
ncbi:MAG: HAD family phosphatase [Gemmatimonadetes bacterium]|jgi:Cof subfamily protein (haloacid dehalogenase superfamily)|nr:HAD family phosphatase [Gemmatimonadota bacterium]